LRTTCPAPSSITFHRRGVVSSVCVTSSPSLLDAPDLETREGLRSALIARGCSGPPTTTRSWGCLKAFQASRGLMADRRANPSRTHESAGLDMTNPGSSPVLIGHLPPSTRPAHGAGNIPQLAKGLASGVAGSYFVLHFPSGRGALTAPAHLSNDLIEIGDCLRQTVSQFRLRFPCQDRLRF
jgi:hypothetical protein